MFLPAVSGKSFYRRPCSHRFQTHHQNRKTNHYQYGQKRLSGNPFDRISFQIKYACFLKIFPTVIADDHQFHR